VNLVAELVRGMRVDDALMQMAVSPKRAAKVVAKVLAILHHMCLLLESQESQRVTARSNDLHLKVSLR
jgi:hypothetical protein